jgi:hypothetical protein
MGIVTAVLCKYYDNFYLLFENEKDLQSPQAVSLRSKSGSDSRQLDRRRSTIYFYYELHVMNRGPPRKNTNNVLLHLRALKSMQNSLKSKSK